MTATNSVLTALYHQRLPPVPEPADVMTALIEVPSGGPGAARQHRRAPGAVV